MFINLICVQMAARSQITVLLLLFLLSTEHSFAGTQNKLTPLVKELLSKYRVGGMFSLAVSIPLNQNQDQNKNKNNNMNMNMNKNQNQNKNQNKNQNQDQDQD
ncbi:probable serine/threonine-protein kinase DDB_G0279405, partial [Pleuronectes platessa]|uniref:probable serine/threonine-protein kinase DDB_G0279405 n=1 Tax=Pleuronectes platessa TaxID=8262 RepID=UPI00232A7899